MSALEPVICATGSDRVPLPSLARATSTAPNATCCPDVPATRMPPAGTSGAGAAWPPPDAEFHQPTLVGASADAGLITAPVPTRPIIAAVPAAPRRAVHLRR